MALSVQDAIQLREMALTMAIEMKQSSDEHSVIRAAESFYRFLTLDVSTAPTVA
jgi:hypothetical protein